MPEYPDIVVYLEALEERLLGRQLQQLTISSPFLLRTTAPQPQMFTGMKVESLQRIGKRVAIGFEQELWLVLHLMIAGRLHWRASAQTPPGKNALCCLTVDTGTLYLTEAGKKKRASLHLLQGNEQLALLEPGGLEVMSATADDFKQRLRSSNHTLKRALTDPRLFSGIGNAYSDEILHRAQLSPIAMSQKLNEDEVNRLYESIRGTLTTWTETLRLARGEGFPEKVTAFRGDMAVHGRYQQPCPVCATAVQRIRYATTETNYCPRCQTGGKVLADRALSRLLKKDWPRTVEELEKT